MDEAIRYLLCEVLNTIIAIATTATVAGVIWLITLRYRSNTIRTLLSNQERRFDLYYRGESDPDKNKRISFNRDGSIGGRSNENEYRWAVSFGSLKIYAKNGKLYSEFKWDKVSGKLRHTNNPKLPSVMGQYITPLYIPNLKPESN